MSEPAGDEPPEPRWQRLGSLMDGDAAALRGLWATALVQPEEVSKCRAWLALRRHATSRLRSWEAFPARAAPEPVAERLQEHRSLLRELAASAGQQQAGFEPGVRHDAASSLGVRVAVVGKGGVGKSVISATMARLLGRRGRSVLAADLDANPGLALSLGLGETEAGLPFEALEEHAGAPYGWQLAPHLGVLEALGRFGVPAPDGVCYLGLGKVRNDDGRSRRQSITAVLQIVSGLGEPDWDVVGDMEAGTTTPYERYHAFADQVLVVVASGWKTRLTARRLAPLLGEVAVTLVANQGGDDPPGASEAPAVRIPFDAAVAEADRAGLAPLDHCPDSPAVKAIGDLTDLVLRKNTELNEGPFPTPP